MDKEGKYHECDICDVKDIGWHACPCCGVEHRPPDEHETTSPESTT